MFAFYACLQHGKHTRPQKNHMNIKSDRHTHTRTNLWPREIYPVDLVGYISINIILCLWPHRIHSLHAGVCISAICICSLRTHSVWCVGDARIALDLLMLHFIFVTAAQYVLIWDAAALSKQHLLQSKVCRLDNIYMLIVFYSNVYSKKVLLWRTGLQNIARFKDTSFMYFYFYSTEGICTISICYHCFWLKHSNDYAWFLFRIPNHLILTHCEA